MFSGDRDGNLARCRSWAVGWRPAKAGGGALSGRIWRELQKGAWTAGRRRAKLGRCRWASGRAGQEAGGIGRAAFGFTELGEVHRNVGIPRWYVGSGIHQNAGPCSGPDDFCGLGGSLRCRPLTGARPENRGPSSKASRPGRAGFSAVNRSGVREAASRTGRKNSAGAGVLGAGAHFRRIWPSCCGGPARRRRSWGRRRRVGEIGRVAFKKQQLRVKLPRKGGETAVNVFYV